MLVVADEFVIASAANDRQVKAIVEEVEHQVARGRACPSRCASRASTTATGCCSTTATWWCTCSCEETREYYELERLWGDVPRIEWAEPVASGAGGAAAT